MDKQELQHQYQLEQFKALRKEIEDNLAQIRRVTYLDVLGSGAIWFLSNTEKFPEEFKFPLYVTAVIISALCGLYIYFLRRDISRIGAFLYKVEIDVLDNVSLGWEHHLKSLNLKLFDNTETFDNIFSFIIVALNLTGALIVFFK